MSLPTHNPPGGHPGQPGQAPPIRPPVQWTIMPPPQVQFAMWVDGSLKITFAPDKADEVILCLEQYISTFKTQKEMINNPPKKCTACRGAGQIMVKRDNGQKEPEVCGKCKGSGQMGLIPPSVASVAAPAIPVMKIPKVVIPPGVPAAQAAMMAPPPGAVIGGVRVEQVDLDSADDEPPHVELPHEKLEVDIDSSVLGQMQKLLSKHGYKVVALSKEEQAESLAALTEENAGKTEPPSAPIEEEPIPLSLEELAARGTP